MGAKQCRHVIRSEYTRPAVPQPPPFVAHYITESSFFVSLITQTSPVPDIAACRTFVRALVIVFFPPSMTLVRIDQWRRERAVAQKGP